MVTLLGRRMERYLEPSARSIRFLPSCAPLAVKGTFASTWKRLSWPFPRRNDCFRAAAKRSVQRLRRRQRKTSHRGSLNREFQCSAKVLESRGVSEDARSVSSKSFRLTSSPLVPRVRAADHLP